MRLRPILTALVTALTLTRPALAEDPPVIAAASDLQFALTEIAEAFTRDTGQTVRISFGSTGNFARQIREGAPFQMFLAADESFVLDLARDGFTHDQGVIYAEGRIVIMIPHDSPLANEDLTLADALAQGKITRFAIANPAHAPYGMRAKEALIHAGLWDVIQPHLVLGENVSQAAQFALSGNAEGGIIAYSLALAPELASQGSFSVIPEDWHEPLLQRMVLLKSAGPVARAFYAYMDSPATLAVMTRYGFVRPEGD